MTTTTTRVIAFADVPALAEFYRRGQPWRWARSGPGVCTVFLPATETGERVQPDPPAHEQVMLHPRWCQKCHAELQWPFPSACPVCGDTDEVRASLPDLERVIGEWTGTSKPHI